MRLHRRVDRERIVLERIEFGQNVEPGGLGEAGQIGGQGRKSGEAGEAGDPDHRRYEDQPIGAFQPVVAERVERVFERQRAAVRVADDMQRLAGARAPAAFADGKAGRGHPVLPFDLGEGARNRAVARKPDADRDKAVGAIELGDMAQAERRVGQPVQQDDRAGRLALGLEDEGAVPVLPEMPGIDRTALEIAVHRHAVAFGKLARDLIPHRIEDPVLRVEVSLPVRGVELARAQLVRRKGVPGLERGPSLRIPGAHSQQRREDGGEREERVFCAAG